MDVKSEKLSTPVLFMVTLEPEEVTEKKEKFFKKIKDQLPEIKGFRKGKIPRDIAEQKFGVEKLYRELLDEIYFETADSNNIISTKEFKVIGDFSDKNPLRLEFIAEVKPGLKIPDLEELEVKYDIDLDVSEEEMKNEIETQKKKYAKEIDLDVSENGVSFGNICIIDFVGFLENENEPFKGGNSKNYRMELGKKQFIDTFEDQMVGMKIGEKRSIHVTFPEDYRDKSKAGKKAKFDVELKAVKEVIIPELNEEFFKMSNFKNYDDMRSKLKARLIDGKEKNEESNFKREIIKTLVEKTEFDPIPLSMIDREVDKEWRAFLYRMGTTEEEYLAKNQDGKNYFEANFCPNAEVIVKTSLIFEEIAKEYKISAEKEEVEKYIRKTSQRFSYTQEQLDEQMKALENPRRYKTLENAVINEKIVDFLTEKLK